jgi:DtxR family transcriptional regulator, Mn-dependent transcriptional regulator
MSESTVRPFSPAVEDYLKTVYKLQQEEKNVLTSDLAKAMGTTPAAASKMFKYLAELRLLDHTPYQGVRLTEAGEKVALEVIRHHRLLELYLHQALGYRWDEVDAEAEKLEHHISEEFEERISQMLGDPQTDPHGDPIPTRDGWIAPQRGVPLTDAEPGDCVIILRVRDRDPEALRYLEKLQMRLASTLEILDKQPFNGPLMIRVGGATHSIGRELAGHVFVENCVPLTLNDDAKEVVKQ